MFVLYVNTALKKKSNKRGNKEGLQRTETFLNEPSLIILRIRLKNPKAQQITTTKKNKSTKQ